jgi:hypothetical protein
MASNLLKQIESDGVSHGGTHVHHFSLANSLYNLTYLTPAIPRDSVMYLNHKALSRALSLEDEKIHGLWGFFHTFQISMQRDCPLSPPAKCPLSLPQLGGVADYLRAGR